MPYMRKIAALVETSNDIKFTIIELEIAFKSHISTQH